MSAAGRRRRARLAAARLYLVATWPRGPSDTADALEAALATGAVDAVQVRAKDLPDEEVVAAAAALVATWGPRGVLVLVNDRVDLALRADADGAHVGEDDPRPETARAALGPDRLLGLSAHDEAEVRTAWARGADHVGLGPCFPTGTKALRRPPGGAALVARCLPHAGDLPVFPIGGVTEENVGLLVRAGARRAAVGAGVLAAPDPAAAALRIRALLDGGTAPPRGA